MRAFSRRVLLLCILNFCLIGILIIYLNIHAKRKMLGDESLRKAFSRSLYFFAEVLRLPVQFCLLEPGILWNLLPAQERLLLLNKGLALDTGFNRVITVAVKEKDLELVLQATENMMSETKRWVFTPDLSNTNATNLLLIRHSTLLHVVVLRSRGDYWWIGKIDNVPTDIRTNIRLKFFGKSNLILNRFGFMKHSDVPLVYIPANITKFLFFVRWSRFVPCLGMPQDSDQSGGRAPMWAFRKTVLETIGEMESLMRNRLAPFWLASGTLLGWYRNCDIIRYTHDADFAAWGADVNGELIAVFKSSQKLHMLNMLGQIALDLEFWLQYQWLRVDLFFVYVTEGGFYAGGHRPEEGYTFRYLLPKFTLCSGDLLGHLVLVPCVPEAILAAEYGENWREPVQNWNYEISARNVDGRRYWKHDEISRFRIFGESGGN